jgi:hypothetical protein
MLAMRDQKQLVERYSAPAPPVLRGAFVAQPGCIMTSAAQSWTGELPAPYFRRPLVIFGYRSARFAKRIGKAAEADLPGSLSLGIAFQAGSQSAPHLALAEGICGTLDRLLWPRSTMKALLSLHSESATRF